MSNPKLFEETPSITPINFFRLSLSCHYLPSKSIFKNMQSSILKKYKLPDTSNLCFEDSFADVFMGWNEKGINFLFKVAKTFEKAYFPEITKGDSIEVFIDTRDIKTSGINTRFCHHFFFLPESVDDKMCGEITRFRVVDEHELADPSALDVKTEFGKSNYDLYAELPKEALHGYDPIQFARIGFAYRINRPYLSGQHFSCVSVDYKFEDKPSLWSSINLEK